MVPFERGIGGKPATWAAESAVAALSITPTEVEQALAARARAAPGWEEVADKVLDRAERHRRRS